MERKLYMNAMNKAVKYAIAVSSVLAIVLGVALISGCTKSANFKEEIVGTWEIYHYYENADGGESVFFDDSNFITVVVDEDGFTLTSKDGSTEPAEGSYTWKSDSVAEVTMSDGTAYTVSFATNDGKHSSTARFDTTVQETNMVYVLEVPED